MKKVTKTTEKLVKKLKEFEGLRQEAYLDAAGKPTIGYGHTLDVRMGDKISAYYAEELLREDIAYVEKKVKRLGVACNAAQLDALVSFAFNLGFGRLKGSTLLRVIREGGSKSAITREFKRWVFAKGQRLRGLERRREWEARRFFE